MESLASPGKQIQNISTANKRMCSLLLYYDCFDCHHSHHNSHTFKRLLPPPLPPAAPSLLRKVAKRNSSQVKIKWIVLKAFTVEWKKLRRRQLLGRLSVRPSVRYYIHSSVLQTQSGVKIIITTASPSASE